MSSLTNKRLIEDRGCNRTKWDRLAEETGPRVFVTHRTW